MDPAVVVVRAAAGVDVELLADAVDLPLQVAVLQFRQRMHRRALEEEIADEQPAEMRRVRDAARLAQRREERDRAHDRDEHLRRDREHEIHVDRAIGEVERVGEQQPVDRARRADDDRVLHLLSESRTAAARTVR